MLEKHKYHTVGRERILRCLADDPKRRMTVGELTEAMARQQVAIGQSTVYRIVGQLCEEGKLRRVRDEARGCYVYGYAEDTQNCDGHHFHLKCVSCGRLFHLECRQSEALCAHIAQSHHFRIDSGRTWLYGQCERCARAAQDTI